jgi:hypothetical protein
MMVDTCNPSSQEAKIGVLRVPSQPGLHGKTLSQNNQKKSHFINMINLVLLVNANGKLKLCFIRFAQQCTFLYPLY